MYKMSESWFEPHEGLGLWWANHEWWVKQTYEHHPDCPASYDHLEKCECEMLPTGTGYATLEQLFTKASYDPYGYIYFVDYKGSLAYIGKTIRPTTRPIESLHQVSNYPAGNPRLDAWHVSAVPLKRLIKKVGLRLSLEDMEIFLIAAAWPSENKIRPTKLRLVEMPYVY